MKYFAVINIIMLMLVGNYKILPVDIYLNYVTYYSNKLKPKYVTATK